MMDLADGHIAALRKLFDDPKIGNDLRRFHSLIGYFLRLVCCDYHKWISQGDFTLLF